MSCLQLTASELLHMDSKIVPLTTFKQYAQASEYRMAKKYSGAAKEEQV